MNLIVLFLALFCVLAVGVGIILYFRLRRKEACLRDALEQSGPSDPLSDTYELTAIDQMLYDRCCRYMTERKPFLVESFSLQDLASAVYTNRSSLSKIINRYSGRNFRQYVNYYRVMHAMDLFRNNMSLRVVDLAQLSGFRSVTAFFQNFKKVMGEPPSQWCARIRRKYIKDLKK